MKVLLLSAYDTPSHRYWCESLQRQLKHIDWTYLTLPGRYFSWRIRGNSLTWSVAERIRLQQPYDLVLATSMTDLATLRGLCPNLAQIPAVVYFHENQFAYPKSASAHPSVEPKMVTLYSALAAERIVFNSNYNRSTFMAGVAELLRQLPDQVPPGIVASLAGKAVVLPVPLAEMESMQPAESAQVLPLELVWNHRWEYDKGPGRLLQALKALPADCALRVHVVGQQFRRQPAEFDQIHALLVQRGWLGHWGYITDHSTYLKLLQSCHGVLSTAEHDFQGLAVLEAVAAGCVPLVPNRLAYPEWFGANFCYEPGELPAGILTLYRALAEGCSPRPPEIKGLSWEALKPKYEALLQEVAGG